MGHYSSPNPSEGEEGGGTGQTALVVGTDGALCSGLLARVLNFLVISRPKHSALNVPITRLCCLFNIGVWILVGQPSLLIKYRYSGRTVCSKELDLWQDGKVQDTIAMKPK